MGIKPADVTEEFGKRTWDMQGLPYRPEAQWSCQRGTDPSKNKELRQLPRTPPREHQGSDQKSPPAAREWYFLSRRIQVQCRVATANFLLIYPLKPPDPMPRSRQERDSQPPKNCPNRPGALGKKPALPQLCAPQRLVDIRKGELPQTQNRCWQQN